eukprot:CAMPEP_0197419958 /NCGR_PEP_ID=MMETSP1170-20131217/5449_1 /TAXON_ID=54406 /ORGANISM="Sarcinochrysis sp, Strain CCMP770" /LENGTH=55 /DNA_ID=CAMNT_0042947077 /DNA_START=318 /DNA_END=482 /DNA_ORIENTATION=-
MVAHGMIIVASSCQSSSWSSWDRDDRSLAGVGASVLDSDEGLLPLLARSSSSSSA